jgi:thiol-disulfide isomerase/thioredoxin
MGSHHSNQAHLPFAIGDARAIVLYFIASDCPISNRLLPEMLRIEQTFAAQRVRFFFVYPNSTETRATIAAHRAAYGIGRKIGRKDTVLTDPGETLARLAGANTTPEAAILIPEGKTLKAVYSGRIDDRSISLGTERPAATRHDLADALAAVLAGRPVPPPGGPPVGCAFMTLAAK